jgi:phytoene synthase
MADLTDRELDAAGITGDQLRPAYRHARSVHAAHGRTYFLATRLLAPAQRPWVHALYGFARYADEIVDDAAGRRLPAAAKAARLDRLGAALDRAMAGTGPIHDPLLIAVAHTANHHRLDRSLFQSFLASMRMDTEIAEYASYAALGQYMYG